MAYKVKDKILHDEEEYVFGKSIDLTPEQAKPLLRAGAILTEEDFEQYKTTQATLEQKNQENEGLAAEVAKYKAELAEMRSKTPNSKVKTAESPQQSPDNGGTNQQPVNQ